MDIKKMKEQHGKPAGEFHYAFFKDAKTGQYTSGFELEGTMVEIIRVMGRVAACNEMVYDLLKQTVDCADEVRAQGKDYGMLELYNNQTNN